jgi:hypothetical protein
MTALEIKIDHEIELDGEAQKFFLAISDLLKAGKPINLTQFKVERHCRILNGGANAIFDKIIRTLKRCDKCQIRIILENDSDGLPSIVLINDNLGDRNLSKSFTLIFNEIGEIEKFHSVMI